MFPSRQEGLPVSLLEAMAHGCPVVATRVGGIPQLVEHGRTGLLVPPRDPAALRAAIETVLADPELGRRMGREARARVASLCSWERITDATLEAYRRDDQGARARALSVRYRRGQAARRSASARSSSTVESSKRGRSAYVAPRVDGLRRR